MKDILVFYDDEFPYEGVRPDISILTEIQLFSDIAGVNSINKMLCSDSYNCFISLHGRYFPEDSWDSIHKHISAGKGFICCGGPAFSMPLKNGQGHWTYESSDSLYYRKLYIHHFEKINKNKINTYEMNNEFPFAAGLNNAVRDSQVFEIALLKSGLEHDKVWDKPSIVMYGLEYGLSKSGQKICAPVVAIENLRGQYAGGRWILISQIINGLFWINEGAGFLKKLSDFCIKGSMELIIKPAYQLYFKDEQPCILIQCPRSKINNKSINILMKVIKEGFTVSEYSVKFISSKKHEYITVPLDFQVSAGFYEVLCSIHIDNVLEGSIHTGFWGYDKISTESVKLTGITGQSFYDEGNYKHIIGINYEPGKRYSEFYNSSNAFKWNHDFKFFQDAGINLISTQMWTSTENFIQGSGIFMEELMRAVDSFLLCAQKHEITVILDVLIPDSKEALELFEKYIPALISRCHRKSNLFWNIRCTGLNDDNCKKSIQRILYLLDNYYEGRPYIYTSPLDCSSFHMHYFNGVSGNIYEEYAACKEYGIPLIINDRGIRYYENIDGTVRHGERKQQNIFEKRLAYSLAAGAAGMIHLMHNTFLDNDLYTGCIRDDETEKLQFRFIREYGRFVGNIGEILSNRKIEQVAVVETSDSEEMHLALKQAIKVLTYDLKVNSRVIRDKDIESIDSIKVIFVPSQGIMNDNIWQKLYDTVNSGAMMLITGPINYKLSGAKVDRILKYTGDTHLKPLSLENELVIGDINCRITFDERITNITGYEVPIEEQKNKLHTINVGSGKIIWCPIPIELNKNLKVVDELYKFILKDAKIQRDFLWKKGKGPGIFAKKVSSEKGYLMIFISETSDDREIELVDRATGMMLSFVLPADRIRLLAFDINNNLIDSYNPEHIRI